MRKLNRVVIKEELVKLTGDFKLAIVLQQMIYWSERIKDVDKYIQEEIERFQKFSIEKKETPNINLANGWIYKKAEELSDETMIGVLPKAMRNYLKILTDSEWLNVRKNPDVPMDRTYQYRVNLIKIQQDLLKLGYSLEGYSIDLGFINRNGFKDSSYFHKENTKGEKEDKKGEKEYRSSEKERAIPETTTETTTETTLNNNIYVEIINYLNTKAGTNYRDTTQKTRKLIDARLNEKFTVEDFFKVIDNMVENWTGKFNKDDVPMENFLRPETLFGHKFESYLNQKTSKKVNSNGSNTKPTDQDFTEPEHKLDLDNL